MTPELATLYQRVILEHNARPHNRGPLDGHTHEGTAHNPLCGDTLTLRLLVDEGRIVTARFEGDGCALSRASASLLTLAVASRTPAEALETAGELERFLTPDRDHEEGAAAGPARLGDLVALQGVRAVPARRRCATIPWEALRVALAV